MDPRGLRESQGECYCLPRCDVRAILVSCRLGYNHWWLSCAPRYNQLPYQLASHRCFYHYSWRILFSQRVYGDVSYQLDSRRQWMQGPYSY